MNKKNKKEKIKKLWQFYTNKDIAKESFSLFKKYIKEFINEKTIFIEPSAWTWSFIDIVKEEKYNIIWYDIDPKREDIKKKDFLWSIMKKLRKSKKNNIIIWNPPFWSRSKLAIDFFNRSTEYSNIIGFILPNHFKKYSAQSKLNKDFILIKEIDLAKNSFHTELNKKYNVNCVFQIWIHKDLNTNNKYKNLRILTKPPIKHEDFEMYQYNNTKQALKVFENDFDFWVFSQWYGDYSIRIYKKEDFNKKKQRLLFKAKNKKVLDILINIDFEKLSKNNTTIPWFRKADVVKEYKEIIRSNKKT